LVFIQLLLSEKPCNTGDDELNALDDDDDDNNDNDVVDVVFDEESTFNVLLLLLLLSLSLVMLLVVMLLLLVIVEVGMTSLVRLGEEDRIDAGVEVEAGAVAVVVIYVDMIINRYACWYTYSY
jgi:uncharacterized BrkB/YihY/UPF0761 family membrane protein